MIDTEHDSSSNISGNDQKSQHWSKDRLHVDVSRAVGDLKNLLREVARISHQIDPFGSDERTVKRVQFLAYELQTYVKYADVKYADVKCADVKYAEVQNITTQNSTTDSRKLEMLNQFFFKQKSFQCVSNLSQTHSQAEAYCLNRVLSSRSGAPIVIELLYAFLAEQIGVVLEFVDLKPTCFLKLCESGHSKFIDVTRFGSTLTSDELIETLHSRFQLTTFSSKTVLEACTFESYITDYLSSLKKNLNMSSIASKPEQGKLLFLQDTLIAYQPSNLQLVGERALLHRSLGNFKSALADLKRFFAFHDRSRSAVELVRLYDELVNLLERNKTNIEILD